MVFLRFHVASCICVYVCESSNVCCGYQFGQCEISHFMESCRFWYSMCTVPILSTKNISQASSELWGGVSLKWRLTGNIGGLNGRSWVWTIYPLWEHQRSDDWFSVWLPLRTWRMCNAVNHNVIRITACMSCMWDAGNKSERSETSRK